MPKRLHTHKRIETIKETVDSHDNTFLLIFFLKVYISSIIVPMYHLRT